MKYKVYLKIIDVKTGKHLNDMSNELYEVITDSLLKVDGPFFVMGLAPKFVSIEDLTEIEKDVKFLSERVISGKERFVGLDFFFEITYTSAHGMQRVIYFRGEGFSQKARHYFDEMFIFDKLDPDVKYVYPSEGGAPIAAEDPQDFSILLQDLLSLASLGEGK